MPMILKIITYKNATAKINTRADDFHIALQIRH